MTARRIKKPTQIPVLRTLQILGAITAPPSPCGGRTQVYVMHICTLSITSLLAAFRRNDSFPQFKRDAFDNRSAIPLHI
jgi:F0F1-type ATP synthase alpha subunit